MTIYGYLRMSTNKQTDSLEVQKSIITAQVIRDGRDPARIVWVTDPATSASIPINAREGGREMCSALRKGDVVYISKLDRAFRNAANCAVTLDAWQRLGVSLCVVNLLGMAIDLSSPIGKFIVLILAAVAELEREYVRERTRDALALRKRKGHANGKYAGYGFMWRKQKDPETGRMVKVKVACPAEREIMKEIVKWRLDDFPWDTILDHVNNVLDRPTKEGKPWSTARLKRAFVAEMKFQTTEGRSTDK